MGRDTLFDIALPSQDVAQFTRFPPREEAARAWAAQLPITNIQAVSAQLQAAASELNRHPLDPDERFRILEVLADYLAITLTNLTRRFLNQPLVLPTGPRQLAQSAEDLLREFQTGYAAAAVDAASRPQHSRGASPGTLVCEATHRAIRFCGRRILLALQLQRPVPAGCWLALHQLYALAESCELTQLRVMVRGGNSSVADAYLQALLPACCKPNQLRQADLTAVYEALGEWSGHLRIDRPGALDGLFAVDLECDQPAVYSALFGEAAPRGLRRIDTRSLVEFLRHLKELDDCEGKRGIRLASGAILHPGMLAHLIEALGSRSMRNFKRVAVDAPVLVSLGLAGAHHHAAGEHDFRRLLYGDIYRDADDGGGSNPFLTTPRHGGDPWATVNPEQDYIRESEPGNGGAFPAHHVELDAFTRGAINAVGTEAPAVREAPVYRVRQVNASPGGYCLEWQQDPPEEVRAGNLVSIQESPGGNWAIAVIRWVSRLEDSRTLVGLELLSPGVTACGVLAPQRAGQEPAPQRALVLPEIKLIGQPATLILPYSGFREGQKVTLLHHGRTRHVRLHKQVSATASYVQFEFSDTQVLGDVLSANHRGPVAAVYDSVWNNI